MTSIQHRSQGNLAHFCGHIISNDGQTCGEAVAESTGDITLRLYRPLIDASYVLKSDRQQPDTKYRVWDQTNATGIKTYNEIGEAQTLGDTTSISLYAAHSDSSFLILEPLG